MLHGKCTAQVPDIVMCILHCTMSIGRLAAMYLVQLCSTRDSSVKNAVSAELRRNHIYINVFATGKKLQKAPNLKGHHTKTLFDMFKRLVLFFNVFKKFVGACVHGPHWPQFWESQTPVATLP